jgi:RAD51-like protein 2
MNPLRGDHGTVSTHIVTFSQKVDDLLGGGIRLGEVTEIAGLPGCGKTQLATQLSVLARLPTTFGGVQGRTLYIDTEGSFTPERAHDMAEALHIHVQDGIERRRKRAKRSSNGNSNQKTNHQVDAAQERDAAAFTEEEILRSIHVFRVHDETALISTLYSLPQYIENSEYLDDEILGADNGTSDCSSTDSLPVRLVVIDSIAFPFRAVAPTDPSYYAQRSKTLTTLASFLGDLATKYNIAVVAINQMTTKMTPSSLRTGGSYADNITALVPALGEAWAHATATRLLLSNSFGPESRIDDSADSSPSQPQQQPSRNQQIRVCELAKSSHRPSGSAKFVIVPEGIRGVEYISHKRPAQAPTAASTTAPQPLQGDTNLHHQSISNGSNKRHLHK